MKNHSDTENTINAVEIDNEDLRLKQLLDIPDTELQPSFHANIQLIPDSDELEIENINFWYRFNLTDEDFNRLQSLGMKGKLRVAGCVSAGPVPIKARALIVARQQIREPIDLPQPNNCEIIYYQTDAGWRKFPEDAPALKKRFRLSIDPTDKNRTQIWAEAYFESEAGGGGSFNWEHLV